jgi:hypothetical protein
VLALLVVVVVLLALAAATFVLSYDGVRAVALEAGVSASLARFYPGALDAAVVIACTAALLLRDGRWWARSYAWLAVILIVVVAGITDAVHAMNVALPHKQTEGVVAAAPWVLVLLAFSLWITILRQSRSEHRPVPAPATPAPDSPAPAGPAPATLPDGLAPATPPETAPPALGPVGAAEPVSETLETPTPQAREQTVPVPTVPAPALLALDTLAAGGPEEVLPDENPPAAALPDEAPPEDGSPEAASDQPEENTPIEGDEPAGQDEAAGPLAEVTEEAPQTDTPAEQALQVAPQEPEEAEEPEGPEELEETEEAPEETVVADDTAVDEDAAVADDTAVIDGAPAPTRSPTRPLDYWDVDEADPTPPADTGSLTAIHHAPDDATAQPQTPALPVASTARFQRLRSTPIAPEEEAQQNP